MVTCLATTCGRRRESGVTSVPSAPARSALAIAPSSTHGSWIGRPAPTMELEVVPEEDAVPPRRLGVDGEIDDRRRVGERGDAHGEAHGPTL